MNRLRQQVKTALDAAIAAGAQPSAPRSGLGLVVKTPAGRFRTLVDKKGLTPAGNYYYDKSGLPPPRSFDYQQDTTRKGRTQYIKLLDGSQKAVSRWDNVNREWKLTKLGHQFYSKAVSKYTILWPVEVILTRINGSLFRRPDWMPSTAIPALGEIEVPRTLSEEQQLQRVKTIERQWRDQQPNIEGKKYFCQAMRPIYMIRPERFSTTRFLCLCRVMCRRSCIGHCGRASHGGSPFGG